MRSSRVARFRRPISRNVALALIALFIFNLGPATGRAGVFQKSEAELIKNADKAINDAQNALSMVSDKESDAALRLDEIRKFSPPENPNETTLSDLRRLAQTIELMFDAEDKKPLQVQLADAQRALLAANEGLKDSKKALDGATSTPNIETAKKLVQAKLDVIKPLLDANGTAVPKLNDLVAALNKALDGVYDSVKKLAETMKKRLAPLEKSTADQNEVFAVFQNNLADLPGLIQFDQDLVEAWKNLSAELDNVAIEPATKAKAQPTLAAVDNFHTAIVGVVNNLNAQVALLTKYAQSRDTALTEIAGRFKANPTDHDTKLLNGITENTLAAAALDKLSSMLSVVSAQAEASAIPNFDADKLQNAKKGLDASINHLSQVIATSQETLSGDRSLWVTEKIRLYYFTDIARLVQTLNPAAARIGGDTAARQREEVRLQKLRDSEDALREADSEVARLKQRKATLERQLQKAQDELDSAKTLASISANRDAELNRRPEADVTAERKQRSLEEKNRREQERADAQQRFDRLNDENTGLPAKLREAEDQLEAAQADFERASSLMIRSAQAESAAFANARDNAPFWFAGATATSSDPARRVEITSSTGGDNTIFVRGRREDVRKVKEIVAKLDEPAPQARMTLWKLELNSDATLKGAERFNKSMEVIEQELASTRAKIATALSLLLESINEQALIAASAAPPVLERKDCGEIGLYKRYGFTDLTGKPIDLQSTDITGRTERQKRYALYAPQVLAEFGALYAGELGFNNPRNFGLKDPASATTLNEALIVLLLADQRYRKDILDRFERKLSDRLQDVTTVKQDSKNRDKHILPLNRHFARLYSMVIEDSPAITPYQTEMTRQQAELVYAIRGLLLRHLVPGITRLQSRIDDFKRLHERGAGRTKEENELYQCLQTKLPKILDTIRDEFLITPADALDGKFKIVSSDSHTIGLQEFDDRRNPIGPPRIYDFSSIPARVAAADGMLDVFIKAFEDDVDREFVQPMLHDLRDRLRKNGVGLGVIQRTSVLATNRLVARVDPRASAELAVGEETNIIQALQQLSQLFLAGQTGGALGALGTFKSQTNDERPPEIYGITSGNAFQVTPIFDPTGQALRFKFDFVDTTLIREPKGTVNPRLPRIERHTVNTEVQLANMEIREVSRFESNAKIGLPTTYAGGLPLLKDLPGFRQIPLIGWFIRRGGQNAISQQSLIFAQTTMSPTIGDILDLLDTSLQKQ